jgi:hypothetical protein
MAHGLGPIELRLVAEVINQMGDRWRPDKVDAERRASSQVRRQMLPNQRRLGRHKNRARVVIAAEARDGAREAGPAGLGPGNCGGKRIRERRPSCWPRTVAPAAASSRTRIVV